LSPHALALALALAAAPAAAATTRSAPRAGEWPGQPPAPRTAQSGLRLPDLATFPAEQQARWPLVLKKCGRCHSMDVSLNQSYTLAEWRASMRRMVRLPGAGITQAQSIEILEFLRYYSTEAVRR
jgi:hypothetical protein